MHMPAVFAVSSNALPGYLSADLRFLHVRKAGSRTVGRLAKGTI